MNIQIQPTQRYIKRIPLTIGLMMVSLLGFTASVDFNHIVDNIVSKNISGNSDNGIGLAFMLGACMIYLVVGIIIILAIALIWRGIAEWPLNQN